MSSTLKPYLDSKKSSLVTGVQGALTCPKSSLGTETMTYTSLGPL